MRNDHFTLKLVSRHFVFLCIMLCCSFASMAQGRDVADAGISSSKQGNKLKAVPLKVFMQEFQKAHGIYFSYHSDVLKETLVVFEPVEKRRKEDPIKLLDRVLASAGLTYQKVDNVYIIKQAAEIKPVSLTEQVIKEDALDFNVSGTVTDANGPVTGVTITEKGTQRATTTNAAGTFTLSVSGAESIIIFSSVGYKAVEVPVGGRSVINVSLESGRAEELSNVVVTALGITKAKDHLPIL